MTSVQIQLSRSAAWLLLHMLTSWLVGHDTFASGISIARPLFIRENRSLPRIQIITTESPLVTLVILLRARIRPITCVVVLGQERPSLTVGTLVPEKISGSAVLWLRLVMTYDVGKQVDSATVVWRLAERCLLQWRSRQFGEIDPKTKIDIISSRHVKHTRRSSHQNSRSFFSLTFDRPMRFELNERHVHIGRF